MDRRRPLPGLAATPRSTKPAASTMTPTNKHARTQSASTSKLMATPSTSPIVPLFITNLRLLDIDLLPDWPGTTAATLTGPDARQRIRSSEFALYQLFRIYDPAVTAEKLQPFFPPLEPLQSVNLRAGLYRCLTEVKKAGVLSREIVLRKTMLDDCQGEKFAEMCLAFSSVVLRRTTRDRKSKTTRPLAERMSMTPGLSTPARESLLPLATAHKAALAKVLEQKQKERETYAQLYDLLEEKEAELEERRATAEQHQRKRLSTGQMDRLNSIEKGLEAQWVGHDELRDAIVNGDGQTASDGMLTKPFEDFWQSKGQNMSASKRDGMGVMEDLERRVNEQSSRIRKWQSTQERILSTMPELPEPLSDGSPSKPPGTSLRLNKHRALSVREAPEEEKPPQEPERTEKESATLRYDQILTAMREELRNGRHPLNTPARLSRRVSAVPAASPRKTSQEMRALTENPNEHSPPSTAVPIRPLMNRSPNAGDKKRSPSRSRSRSYQAPKVDSMRQPIPFKSESFTPRLGSRPSSAASPESASSSTTPPADGRDSRAEERDATWRASQFSQASQGSEMDKTIDSGVGLGIDSDDGRDSLGTSRHGSEDRDVTSPLSASHQSTAHVRHQSLAERTRMSMAFTRPAVETPPEQCIEDPLADLTPKPHTNALNERPSLAERTRQSISLAPTLPVSNAAKTPMGHTRTRSNATPNTASRWGDAATPNKPIVQRRDITPRDQIFSPDAAYESVFKTRPKIALSPVMSPQAGDASQVIEEDGLEA